MADPTTNLVADYVAKHGIRRTALSQATGISEGILFRSLSSRERGLRADEFLRVCLFLDIDPREFAEKE